MKAIRKPTQQSLLALLLSIATLNERCAVGEEIRRLRKDNAVNNVAPTNDSSTSDTPDSRLDQSMSTPLISDDYSWHELELTSMSQPKKELSIPHSRLELHDSEDTMLHMLEVDDFTVLDFAKEESLSVDMSVEGDYLWELEQAEVESLSVDVSLSMQGVDDYSWQEMVQAELHVSISMQVVPFSIVGVDDYSWQELAQSELAEISMSMMVIGSLSVPSSASDYSWQELEQAQLVDMSMSMTADSSLSLPSIESDYSWQELEQAELMELSMSMQVPSLSVQDVNADYSWDELEQAGLVGLSMSIPGEIGPNLSMSLPNVDADYSWHELEEAKFDASISMQYMSLPMDVHGIDDYSWHEFEVESTDLSMSMAADLGDLPLSLHEDEMSSVSLSMSTQESEDFSWHELLEAEVELSMSTALESDESISFQETNDATQSMSMPVIDDFPWHELVNAELEGFSMSMMLDMSMSIVDHLNDAEEDDDRNSDVFGSNESTIMPTSGPTAEPSTEPSSGPTASPSDVPTSGPSVEPTDGPTPGPTFSPSLEPSPGPTSEPSTSPSSEPTTAGPSTAPVSDPPTISFENANVQGTSDLMTVNPTQSRTPSPSSSPTLVRITQQSALVQFEMVSMISIMSDDEVVAIFQPSCKDFLTFQLKYEENVSNIECKVTNQHLVASSSSEPIRLRRRLDEASSSLFVHMIVTGFASTSGMPLEDMVQTAFEERSELFVIELKNEGRAAGSTTFNELYRVTSVEQRSVDSAIGAEGGSNDDQGANTGALVVIITGVGLIVAVIAAFATYRSNNRSPFRAIEDQTIRSAPLSIDLGPHEQPVLGIKQQEALAVSPKMSGAASPRKSEAATSPKKSMMDFDFGFLSAFSQDSEKEKKSYLPKGLRNDNLPVIVPKVRREVVAPRGKLGIVCDDTPGGVTIHSVREDSPLEGLLFSGDLIEALDGKDVTHLSSSSLTKLMTSKSNCMRKITVLSERIHTTYSDS